MAAADAIKERNRFVTQLKTLNYKMHHLELKYLYRRTLTAEDI